MYSLQDSGIIERHSVSGPVFTLHFLPQLHSCFQIINSLKIDSTGAGQKSFHFLFSTTANTLTGGPQIHPALPMLSSLSKLPALLCLSITICHSYYIPISLPTKYRTTTLTRASNRSSAYELHGLLHQAHHPMFTPTTIPLLLIMRHQPPLFPSSHFHLLCHKNNCCTVHPHITRRDEIKQSLIIKGAFLPEKYLHYLISYLDEQTITSREWQDNCEAIIGGENLLLLISSPTFLYPINDRPETLLFQHYHRNILGLNPTPPT